MAKDDGLETEIKKMNSLLVRLYDKQSLGRAFLTGVVTGLGSVIGATLVVALIVYILGKIQFVPVIGSWIGQIAAEAAKNLPKK